MFGGERILNAPFITDWEAIRRREQDLIDKNNQNKNANCKPHNYIVRDKVLVHDKKPNKYEEPYKGPYPITNVWTNGTVTI